MEITIIAILLVAVAAFVLVGYKRNSNKKRSEQINKGAKPGRPL